MLNALQDAASTSIPPETWRDLTVMIIDPNHYMRGIVADALRRLNIGSIISAPTADDAREAAHTIKPQIIIVDWAAGGMSGLEYTRSVRRNEQGVLRETPIILLASSVAHDQLIAARQSGINELLLKPVSVRAMKSRVEEVVLRPRKFIDSRHYVGPCRRRKQSADYYGPWRRLVDEPGIKQNPIRSPEDHSKLRAMVAQLTDYAVQDADDTRMVIRGLYRLLEKNLPSVEELEDEVLCRVWRSGLRYVEGVGMTDSYDPEVMLRHFQSIANILDMPDDAYLHRDSVAKELERLVTKRIHSVEQTARGAA